MKIFWAVFFAILAAAAVIAVDELYEAAISGSDAAREKLHSLADNLIETAGLYGRQIRRAVKA